MDLWIRTQDRTRIIKSKDIAIIPVIYNYGTKREINSYKIVEVCYQNIECECLGVYKTKERALEILDEIQKYLEKMGTTELLTNEIGILNGTKHYGIVYEMPE